LLAGFESFGLRFYKRFSKFSQVRAHAHDDGFGVLGLRRRLSDSR
jgi:hypothetical protein